MIVNVSQSSGVAVITVHLSVMLANYGESNQLVADSCPRGIKKDYFFHQWVIKGKTAVRSERKSVKLTA
jgi:hypothetical protein